MKKLVHILNPSETILWFYDHKINASTASHYLDEKEIDFLRANDFIVVYDESVKITRTMVIK